MQLDKVKEIKSDILLNLRSDTAVVSTLPRAFADDFRRFREARHRRMLAVGYSRRADNDYVLELRVRAARGTAFGLASQIKETLGSDTNIAILNRISAPDEIRTASPDTSAAIEDGLVATLRSRHSPLQLGSSIGNFEGTSGSVGGFLIDENDEHRYVLSCNHVLALCNEAPVGSFIVHPGPSDVKPTYVHRVGTLSDYVNILTRFSPNESDAALAHLYPPAQVEITGNIVPRGAPNSGSVIRPLFGDYPVRGAEVEKVGRTTGHTVGLVGPVSLDGIEVEYRVATESGMLTKVYTFDNVIEVSAKPPFEKFSDQGDSGSLVYTNIDGEFRAIGIIFAGATTSELDGSGLTSVSLCCTLKDILGSFSSLSWMGATYEY